MQHLGALMGLWETRRPLVSSVEVVSAWRLQRSVGVRLLFYLSMQDLATGRRLQATQPSQVHCCLFALQQQLVLRRVRHRIWAKERAAFYEEVSVKNNRAQKKRSVLFSMMVRPKLKRLSLNFPTDTGKALLQSFFKWHTLILHLWC